MVYSGTALRRGRLSEPESTTQRSHLFRSDGRANDEPRPITITPSYLAFPEGSALIAVGETRVICTASVEERVPPFMRGQGKGWVTAEYSMLPRSTLTRRARETGPGGVGGRSQEIQRLIGRSLRAVTDLKALGERTVTIDCDVIQADGGTRTASVTGAYVALHQAFQYLVSTRALPSVPVISAVAATSVGLVEGEALLDLCYDEDFRAEADFNVVMTGDGEFVELQGTAESAPFSRSRLDDLLAQAEKGIQAGLAAQRQALGTA